MLQRGLRRGSGLGLEFNVAWTTFHRDKNIPFGVNRSTSTVGLPRESNIYAPLSASEWKERERSSPGERKFWRLTSWRLKVM